MNLDTKHRGFALTLAGFAALALTVAARAADPPEQDEPPARGEETITEQSIYIPYTKLRTIFEREGRGVFLPYEEFQELWRAARDNTHQPAEDRPPVDALITKAEHDATISKDVVRVNCRLNIELLAKGWTEIPLRLGDAAITQATLDDEPARIVFEPGVGHKLLVEKRDQQAKLLVLSLAYAKAFTKTPGKNSISFEAPLAPVSRWRIRIPEAGVKVNVRPLIAATEVPGDAASSDQPDQTVVLAFAGAAPTVSIDWTPKSEGATGLEALANVQAEQQVTVDEGVVRTRSRLNYEISRAELSQIVVEVPATHKVVNVFDPNIRQWSVEEVDERRRITAQLFEPARQTQSVTVELEKFTSDDERTDVKIPVIRALGTGRQQGVVVVELAAGLRAEAVRHTGLLQIDATELPASLAKGGWAFSYRYVSLPFDLALRTEKIQPQITVETVVDAYLQPERLTLDTLAVYNVERAGVFRLELDIPAGYDVRHVRGRAVHGAQPAQVDSHHLEGSEKTHMVVNLSRKAFGRVALAVKLSRRLAEPDLLSPTGKVVDIQLDIPRTTRTATVRERGRLLIHAPESLRVNPDQVEGLRSISFKEAVEGADSVQNAGRSGSRPVLAYAYTQENVQLTLAVERRKPHVTARQLLMVRIEAGVVEYEATFFYDVRYSGVQSLRIDVPVDLAEQIRNKTPGIRRKEIEPPPGNLPAGYVAWGLSGETEFQGNVTIRLVWEEKIEKLEVGKSVERTIPHLRPAAVDRAWGQIVLAKAETIDVQATDTPRGVRPIDPQHDLMPGADVTGGALAFEFHDDWALDVTATRYQLSEVKRTSIERAVLQMVITRSGKMSVQALYRMRSARQRLAVKLPDNVDFDNEPLRINGRPVPLEEGDKKNYYIPLAGQNADEPFLLELRYLISQDGTRLDCPVFPSEPAVQKVYLCAYLPRELAYLGSIGPWTDELAWRWDPILNCTASPRRSGTQLAAWVTQGINVAGNPSDTFHQDGRLYLFSTLRPPSDASGSLRLITLDEDWLSVLVLVPVILIGLILLRKRASTRWLVAGVLVVLLVLMGVFFPTLLRQTVDDRLLCAVLIVLVVWLIQYVVWIRPRDPVVAARKAARLDAALARMKPPAASTAPAVSAEPSPSQEDSQPDSPRSEDNEEGGRKNA